MNKLDKFDLEAPLPDVSSFDLSMEILKNSLADFNLLLHYSA